MVPVEEYRRLYTTRYNISANALALLLKKATKRTIGKNGVQCFQKHWFYFDESMSPYKGMAVEVRYSDDDYTRVWVILPDGHICEAQLITPTSILHPNKQTLKIVSEAQANDRKVMREFNLITQSMLRGETLEERAASQLEIGTNGGELNDDVTSNQSSVHLLTRMSRKTLRPVESKNRVTPAEVSVISSDTSILETHQVVQVSEFDGDE